MRGVPPSTSTRPRRTSSRGADRCALWRRGLTSHSAPSLVASRPFATSRTPSLRRRRSGAATAEEHAASGRSRSRDSPRVQPPADGRQAGTGARRARRSSALRSGCRRASRPTASCRRPHQAPPAVPTRQGSGPAPSVAAPSPDRTRRQRIFPGPLVDRAAARLVHQTLPPAALVVLDLAGFRVRHNPRRIRGWRSHRTARCPGCSSASTSSSSSLRKTRRRSTARFSKGRRRTGTRRATARTPGCSM